MRKASTPFIAEPTAPDFSDGYANTPSDAEVAAAETALRKESENPQALKPYAAKVLMKVLYAARYARFDLLRAVCFLAQYITKWDATCDKRLYTLDLPPTSDRLDRRWVRELSSPSICRR